MDDPILSGLHPSSQGQCQNLGTDTSPHCDDSNRIEKSISFLLHGLSKAIQSLLGSYQAIYGHRSRRARENLAMSRIPKPPRFFLLARHLSILFFLFPSYLFYPFPKEGSLKLLYLSQGFHVHYQGSNAMNSFRCKNGLD